MATSSGIFLVFSYDSPALFGLSHAHTPSLSPKLGTSATLSCGQVSCLGSSVALHTQAGFQAPHLTLCLALWSNGAPDALTQGKVLDEGEAWEDGTVGLCSLPKIELHRTVLHQDVRVERLTP